jgi:hypothetical protein
VAAVALGIVGLLAFSEDPLEAARRRVPLGADEEAVAQAVGRRADGRVGLAGKTAELTRFALFGERGDDRLGVQFDEDGRAVQADIGRWTPTLWERFRAWLGLSGQRRCRGVACPGREYAACCAFARRWNLRLGPGWRACYNDATDAFVFQAPGEPEPRGFQPYGPRINGVPTQGWAAVVPGPGRAVTVSCVRIGPGRPPERGP